MAESNIDLRGLSVWNVITRNASIRGGDCAFRDDDTVISHSSFRERCESLAAILAGAGLAPGHRIAVLAENRLELHVLHGAAARLGVIVVPLNWRLTETELLKILDDCDPAMLVADDATSAIASSLAESRHIALAATFGTPSGSFRSLAALVSAPPGTLPAPPASNDTLLLIYTAAVDGVARGAMITHGNMVAAAAQLCLATGITGNDVLLGNLPGFHIMGLGFAFAVQFAGGATVVRPRFEPSDAAGTIAAGGVTVTGTFPPMLSAILDAAASAGSDLGSLRVCLGLEAPDVIRRLETEWPAARFWTGFGQTETTGMVTMGMASVRPGASGLQGPLCEMAIVDEADVPLPAGAVGEIAVRGPTVMAGYWRRDDENAIVFRNGWHHTGDLGRLDDEGWLHYAGRTAAKDLIKTGGENVYPAEVEQVLLQHNSVREAVVFGLADPHWGEIVAAVVVLYAGGSADADALADYVAHRIARYKRPRRIHFATELPKDQVGRIDRAAVLASLSPTPIQPKTPRNADT